MSQKMPEKTFERINMNFLVNQFTREEIDAEIRKQESSNPKIITKPLTAEQEEVAEFKRQLKMNPDLFKKPKLFLPHKAPLSPIVGSEQDFGHVNDDDDEEEFDDDYSYANTEEFPVYRGVPQQHGKFIGPLVKNTTQTKPIQVPKKKPIAEPEFLYEPMGDYSLVETPVPSPIPPKIQLTQQQPSLVRTKTQRVVNMPRSLSSKPIIAETKPKTYRFPLPQNPVPEFIYTTPQKIQHKPPTKPQLTPPQPGLVKSKTEKMPKNPIIPSKPKTYNFPTEGIYEPMGDYSFAKSESDKLKQSQSIIRSSRLTANSKNLATVATSITQSKSSQQISTQKREIRVVSPDTKKRMDRTQSLSQIYRLTNPSQISVNTTPTQPKPIEPERKSRQTSTKLDVTGFTQRSKSIHVIKAVMPAPRNITPHKYQAPITTRKPKPELASEKTRTFIIENKEIKFTGLSEQQIDQKLREHLNTQMPLVRSATQKINPISHINNFEGLNFSQIEHKLNHSFSYNKTASVVQDTDFQSFNYIEHHEKELQLQQPIRSKSYHISSTRIRQDPMLIRDLRNPFDFSDYDENIGINHQYVLPVVVDHHEQVYNIEKIPSQQLKDILLKIDSKYNLSQSQLFVF